MDQSNSPKEQSSPCWRCDSQRNGSQALPRPHNQHHNWHPGWSSQDGSSGEKTAGTESPPDLQGDSLPWGVSTLTPWQEQVQRTPKWQSSWGESKPLIPQPAISTPPKGSGVPGQEETSTPHACASCSPQFAIQNSLTEMELPHLDFGNRGKSALNAAVAVCLAGLLREEQKGRAGDRQGILPISPTSPHGTALLQGLALLLTSSSVCQAGHKTRGCSFVEKDKLISQHSTDKKHTASKITQSKADTITSTWVHITMGSFQDFPTQVYKFLSPVHRPCSHWIFQTFLTPMTINSSFSLPSCEDTAVIWILITKYTETEQYFSKTF